MALTTDAKQVLVTRPYFLLALLRSFESSVTYEQKVARNSRVSGFRVKHPLAKGYSSTSYKHQHINIINSLAIDCQSRNDV